MQSYVPQSEQSENACNNARLAVACVPTVTAPQHFGLAANERRKVQFGAFQTFVQVAEKAKGQAMRGLIPSDMPFPEAAEVWLAHRTIYIRESTVNCYRDYLSRLKTFFTMPVGDIHIGHIVAYQGEMKRRYHPASVNHDINTLSQILKKAGLWAAIKEHYRPLPLPEKDPPKVMSEAEEQQFFEFVARRENENYWLAYFVASLTNNTTASGKELRMLKLGDIHMEANPPHFIVPKNMKTPDRARLIPLNVRGRRIMERVLSRAAKKGATRPEHYLFPFRIKRKLFDPSRPASESWLKYQWKMLVEAALKAGVLSFRIKPHNLRHQSITKMIDAGIPIETVRQIAGHGVDSVITRHYAHARIETMARALDLIDPDKKQPSAEISTGKKKKGASNAS